MAHGEIPRFNENPLDAFDWDEFDYLLPDIAKFGPDSFLPQDLKTINSLKALGETMAKDPQETDSDNSTIPAPYTYLGQFIDHDVTLTTSVGALDPDLEISKPDFQPMKPTEAVSMLRNRRTSGFDLDSLYGLQPAAAEAELSVPFSGDKFELGQVSIIGNRPNGKSDDNDLPRVRANATRFAKRARIGDPRNDENTIVAQLHLAFLKFHNAVIDRGLSFDVARAMVTHHYQWIVLTDFLPRICDANTVRSILERGNRLYRPIGNEKYMPFEFAVAAYRFGHSMVRSSYDFNVNFRKQNGAQAVGTLNLLFTFTGLSGDLGGKDTLPENWIIEWELMLKDRTMKIDPTITPFLAKLPGQPEPQDVMARLAKRNLLKGYLFSLPTGQALAEAFLPLSDHLTTADLEAACRPKAPGENNSQWELLRDAGFHTKTPLWFYILAEAKVKGGGNHLGPLGSLIVGETIIGLMRANPNSILNVPFIPTLGATVGRFDLQDLLTVAGVLDRRVSEN